MEDKLKNKLRSQREIHPQENGNFLKHLFFCWQIPIFIKGLKKDLNEDDLYSTLQAHQSRILGDKLQEQWLREVKSRKVPSLRRAVFRTFGLELVIKGLLYLPIEITVFICQPFFLSKLLDHFTEKSKSYKYEAYVYASSITMLAFFRALCFNFLLMEMAVLGMKMRIACSSLIYRNILKMRNVTSLDLTVGQMVNLLSNDVGKFDEACTFVQYVWIAPVEIIVGVIYLTWQIGLAAIAGIGFLILCLIFQMYISNKIFQKRRQIAPKTDKRVSLVNDLISGIRAIKMYTWEDYFVQLIQTARRTEIRKVKTANYYRLGINSFKLYSTPVSIFVGVLALVATRTPLTPQHIYTMESIYETLMLSVVILLPISLIRIPEVNISIERIEFFLLKINVNSEPEKRDRHHSQESILTCHNIFQEGPHCISIRNVSAKWNPSATYNVLNNITFTARATDLIGVIGPSGSGKTTLLKAILGEIETYGGTIHTEGSVSYASQEPWIFSGSIRQNIVFGEDLNIEKYHIITQICGLEHDLLSLSQGDATIVGERGATLSGGQKARISLARAIYREADIYLLDDPLSAVDAHVAKQIFDKCILNYLKRKCVILVTHQVRYLQTASKIYFLEGGKIRDCGKYGKIVGLKVDVDDVSETATFPSHVGVPLKQNELKDEFKEHRTSGRNSINIYKRYFQASGHWSFSIVLIFLITLYQIFVNACDYFLSAWINSAVELMDSGKILHFFYLYLTVLVSIIITASFTVWVIVQYNINVSINLHHGLLRKIVYSPIAFFNQNSSGRILNRFTKDIAIVDEMLPLTVMNITTGLLLLLGSIVLVCLINYWMILVSSVLIFTLCACATVFQSTNRNIKRTEAATYSLVLAHVTATVEGLATIRAAECQEVLRHEFHKHQDLNTSASYLLTALYCALGYWTDVLCSVYVAAVTFGFLLIPHDLVPSFIGLAITQATALVGTFQYITKLWAEVETQMTSVERVLEYSDLSEESDNGEFVPSDSWPLAGIITFDSVSMRYGLQQPYALKGLSVHIHAGQRIGIVGRTGAGKSSLISALFRMFDFDGTIIIDGIDTKSLPLKHLRSKISIIPQDPVLFSGSLRENIDPWNKYSDSKIWTTLEELNLKRMVTGLSLGLDTEISEGGSNFSVGQKQLICLVRAVLQNNRIIVLDEATANLDLETDSVIQEIIRKKFDGSTVLTIAHRLNTITDSDKILVLDGGTIVEFDRPYALLQNPDSIFCKHVKEHGFRVAQDMIAKSKLVNK